MFTPFVVISFNQGKDLAHWHICRLYSEPNDTNVDQIEAKAASPFLLRMAPPAAVPERPLSPSSQFPGTGRLRSS